MKNEIFVGNKSKQTLKQQYNWYSEALAWIDNIYHFEQWHRYYHAPQWLNDQKCSYMTFHHHHLSTMNALDRSVKIRDRFDYPAVAEMSMENEKKRQSIGC